MKLQLISSLILACSLSGLGNTANAVQLISLEEARLPNQELSLIPRGIVRGPSVQVISPELGSSLIGAFDLRIKFEPRGGNRVDPESVKVTYLKNPAVDLTPRVKSNVSDAGMNVAGAEVPPGDHLIRVSVKDVSGRESAIVLNLQARK